MKPGCFVFMPRALLSALIMSLFVSPYTAAMINAQLTAIASKDAAQAEKEANRLRLGSKIEQELAGDQEHSYEIALGISQFLNIVVDQRGVDVVVTLIAPDGRQVLEVDSPNGTQGPEPVFIITEAPGIYRLIVKSLEKQAPKGRYEIQVIELRAATTKDRSLQEARKLFAESIKMLQQGNYDAALPVAERALAIREGVRGHEHADVARDLTNIAEIYHFKQDYAKALPLLERALAIREKVLGAEHPDTIQAIINVAVIHNWTGTYEKAEPLYGRALSLREKTLGREHPAVADSLASLAEMYFLKSDYAKAEPLLLRALAIREKAFGREHPNVADSLRRLASNYFWKGSYVQAQDLAERAVALHQKAVGPEHPDLAPALSTLAAIYEAKGEYAKVIELATRALAITEKKNGPMHTEVASSLSYLAQAHLATGDFASAEPLLLRALSIVEKVFGPEHRQAARFVRDLAGLYQRKRDYQKAESLYQRSLAIHEKAYGPQHPQVASALQSLAMFYTEKNDYTRKSDDAKAIPLAERALAILEKAHGPDSFAVADSAISLAKIYDGIGDYKKAELLFQRVLPIYEKTSGPQNLNVATILANLARIYNYKKNYVKAELFFQRALAIGEKVLGPEHPYVGDILSALAKNYIDTQEDPAKTKSLIERALAIYEKAYGADHNRAAWALSLMGVFYLAARDYEKAEQAVQRALTILERVSGPEHISLGTQFNHLAVINQAKGNAARAIEFLTRSIEMSERRLTLGLTIGSERQKRLYLDTLIADINTAISLHVQSAPNDRAAGRLALTTILRRKGRALDAMTESIGALRSRLDPKDRELLDQLTDTRAQLATLALKRSGKINVTQYRVETKRLEDQVEKLEAEVGARSAEFRVQSIPVTLEAIQAAIPRDMILVEFMSYRPFNPRALKWTERLDERHYIAYLLGNADEIKWVDLGEAKPIDAAIGALREALRDPRQKDVKRLARAVDRRAMQPIRKLLGTTQKVLLSPDGALNLLPFAALVDERNRYLVEHYTFTYLTSGRDLLRLQARGKSAGAAVIVADPDFGGQASSDTQRGLKISKTVQNDAANFPEIYFSPLPGTAEEAQALSEILKGATVLTRTQATEAALKQVVAPDILHVATHGFFLQDVVMNLEQSLSRGLQINQGQSGGEPALETTMENPLLRSGLGLAGANLKENGEEDGVLTALEAAGLNLWGTKLVVLSACDTGVGEVKNGEGVYGLRRALILAGSESQVMSLWPVSDDATRDLMIDYYKALQAGQGRSGALRGVQLGMLASRNWRHPYYWASFIQSGEWDDMKGQRDF